MSSKHKPQHKRPGLAVASGQDLEAAAGQVRDLLALGKSRPALEAAKVLHKRQGSAESEGLLIDAYLARVRALLAQGMETEANALLDLARLRHPALALRQDELLDLQATQGKLDDVLRPLADPALTDERRAAIEATLKRHLLDPADLAQCEALPADHPLRRGATEVVRALRAAASRPVTDEEIALPEIPRRSPLAPWKLLARAIAAFHRGDAAACEQALAAIEPDTAPGRLAPLLRAMLADQPPDDPLARQLSGRVEGLRRALAALDAAFDTGRPPQILEAIRRAVKACREERPDLLDALRQRVSVRAIMLGAPFVEIYGALGGAPRKDASFWRLYARAHEELGRTHVLIATIGWDRFLHHALAEGWLAAGGPEEAALYRHMAGLYAAFRGHYASFLRERAKATPATMNKQVLDYYKGQPEEVRRAADLPRNGKFDFYMFFPERLYERSCALDPQDETFREWLEWSRASDGGNIEAVAQAWHRALPGQPAPLLELMNEAERRGALKKALGWLEQAERLDALNPDVRRARWRILLFTAMNHLKQKKAHLVAKDLAQMESLELAREGDRPILLAVLRWLTALLERDAVQLETSFAEAARLTGEPHASAAALSALASHVGLKREMAAALSKKELPPLTKDFVEAFLRVTAVLEECRVSISLPESRRDELIKLIQSGDCQIDAARLVRLARTALKTQDPILAYAATGVGLARGDGPETAALLLLRGRSLPRGLEIRRENCILAALVMARQRRDMELYAEALDEWRELNAPMLGGRGTDKEDLQMDPRHLERVLAFERARSAYPHRPDLDEEENYLIDCPCERCREEFREDERAGCSNWFDDNDPYGLDDDDEDDDEAPEEDLFGPVPKTPKPKKTSHAPDAGLPAGLLPPGMPPAVLAPLMELMAKYLGADGSLPSIDELLELEPAIAKKLNKVLQESGYEPTGGADDAAGFEKGFNAGPDYGLDEIFLPPRQRTRSMRKRKTKKKK